MKLDLKKITLFIGILTIFSGCDTESNIISEFENVKTVSAVQKEVSEINYNKDTINYVGITAHVKEINNHSLIITSDTNDFPGAFSVIRSQGEIAEVKGGDFIQILMKDTNKKYNHKLPEYSEESIVVLDKEEELAQYDIMLTSAPEFVLIDTLSSQLNSIKIKSGNYSWNFKEDDKIKSITACGLEPIKEAKGDFAPKLKLPKYNKIDDVPYSFSTKIPPDMLTVSQWDIDDIDNSNIKKQTITTYYYKNPLLKLKTGKVYEFKAEWKKENLDKNNFYGTASYILVTDSNYSNSDVN